MKKVISILIIAGAVMTSGCIDQPVNHEKEAISLDNVTGGRPYSPAIRVNNMLFVSGQVAIDPETGKMVEGGIEDQTDQVMKNLKAIVEKAGFGMDNVVKCTVLLADISYYGQMNGIYSTYFESSPPARKAFAVKDLPLGALVEIDAVAIK